MDKDYLDQLTEHLANHGKVQSVIVLALVNEVKKLQEEVNDLKAEIKYNESHH